MGAFGLDADHARGCHCSALAELQENVSNARIVACTKEQKRVLVTRAVSVATRRHVPSPGGGRPGWSSLQVPPQILLEVPEAVLPCLALRVEELPHFLCSRVRTHSLLSALGCCQSSVPIRHQRIHNRAQTG